MAGWDDMARDTSNFNGIGTGSVDFCAQGLHAGECGGTVGAGGEVGEARDAFGEGGQHAVAMADGLVAGEAQAPVDVAGGSDESFFGGGMQEELRGVWVSL